MSEKFTKQDQLSAMEETKEIVSDLKDTEAYVEVQKAIKNPELIKDLPFSKLADLLNKAGCNNYSKHPLKDIIGKIIDERYPHSDGWESFEGNGGYIDSWTRNKNGKQVGIQCTLLGEEPNVEYSWSGTE